MKNGNWHLDTRSTVYCLVYCHRSAYSIISLLLEFVRRLGECRLEELLGSFISVENENQDILLKGMNGLFQFEGIVPLFHWHCCLQPIFLFRPNCPCRWFKSSKMHLSVPSYWREVILVESSLRKYIMGCHDSTHSSVWEPEAVELRKHCNASGWKYFCFQMKMFQMLLTRKLKLSSGSSCFFLQY